MTANFIIFFFTIHNKFPSIRIENMGESQGENENNGEAESSDICTDGDGFSFSHSAKFFGSRGQQRSAVLALKLAEGEMLRSLTGEYPVFLFDDVLSELDAERRNFILSELSGRQVIVTCGDVDASFGSLPNAKLIRAEGGIYYG